MNAIDEEQIRNKLIDYMKTINPLVRFNVIKRSKKYKDIYDYVLEKTKHITDIPFSARVYFVISNDIRYRKCALKGCQNDIPHNRQADPFKGYESKYCSSSCSQKSEETRKKIEKSSMEKYGTRLPQLSKVVKEKISETKKLKSLKENELINEKRKQTCIKKYGTNFASENSDIKKKISDSLRSRSLSEKELTKEKTIKTNIERYGVEYPIQSDKIKEIMKKRNNEKYGCDWLLQNENIREKSRKTCLSKYGFEIASKSDIVKKHTKDYFLKKFNLEHPMMLDEIKEKQKKSVREKYGVDKPLQNEEIKRKTIQTNLKRYGSSWPMSNHNVKCKARGKYEYEGIYFDSGVEMAYFIWLKDNNIKFTYHPEGIKYLDNNGVERKYFPDFLVEGKLVELKGDLWWENASKEKKETILKNVDIILFKKDYKKYIDFVKTKYGTNFIKKHKRKNT